MFFVRWFVRSPNATSSSFSCVELKELNAEKNQIKTVDDIGHCKKLAKLLLDQNPLTVVGGIGALSELHELTIDASLLPPALASLPQGIDGDGRFVKAVLDAVKSTGGSLSKAAPAASKK